jgi:hypothetical protein
MKLIISLAALVLTSTAYADFRCVSQEEAIILATSKIESLRNDIYSESYLWVKRDKIQDYLSRIEFIQSEEKYTTGVLVKWTCAAGSDCYMGIQVTCNGDVGTFLYAD